MTIETSGLHTDTVATEAASLPVASEICCTTNARTPAMGNGLALPLVQAAPIPVVAEDLDRRLAQQHRQAVQDTGAGAVQGRLPERACPSLRGRAARRRQSAEARKTAAAHSRAGALSLPSPAFPTTREDREAEHNNSCAAHLAFVDDLVGQEVAEREREHDRRHEQRLDHREPAVRERDRLERVAAQQRDRAQEPPGLLDEIQQRLGEPR